MYSYSAQSSHKILKFLTNTRIMSKNISLNLMPIGHIYEIGK